MQLKDYHAPPGYIANHPYFQSLHDVDGRLSDTGDQPVWVPSEDGDGPIVRCGLDFALPESTLHLPSAGLLEADSRFTRSWTRKWVLVRVMREEATPGC